MLFNRGTFEHRRPLQGRTKAHKSTLLRSSMNDFPNDVQKIMFFYILHGPKSNTSPLLSPTAIVFPITEWANFSTPPSCPAPLSKYLIRERTRELEAPETTVTPSPVPKAIWPKRVWVPKTKKLFFETNKLFSVFSFLNSCISPIQSSLRHRALCFLKSALGLSDPKRRGFRRCFLQQPSDVSRASCQALHSFARATSELERGMESGGPAA